MPKPGWGVRKSLWRGRSGGKGFTAGRSMAEEEPRHTAARSLPFSRPRLFPAAPSLSTTVSPSSAGFLFPKLPPPLQGSAAPGPLPRDFWGAGTPSARTNGHRPHRWPRGIRSVGAGAGSSPPALFTRHIPGLEEAVQGRSPSGDKPSRHQLPVLAGEGWWEPRAPRGELSTNTVPKQCRAAAPASSLLSGLCSLPCCARLPTRAGWRSWRRGHSYRGGQELTRGQQRAGAGREQPWGGWSS